MPDDNTPAAAEPAAPQQYEPNGPWAADLRQSFTDPQVMAQVDQFLRSRVQPRVTQLEQSAAEAREATNLMNAFQEDPVGTYRAVEAQLREAGLLEEQQAAAAAAAPAPPAAPQQASDPRLEEMYTSWKEQQELSAYDQSIAQIVNDPANADIDPNLLHGFVLASNGDFNQAVDLYRSEAAKWAEKFGAAAPAPAEGEAAPPVMGQNAGGASGATPVVPDYAGMNPQDALHKAIEDAAHASVRSGQAAPPIS